MSDDIDDLTTLDGISPGTSLAIRRAIRSGFSPMSVEPPMSLSRWSAEHFYLSAESSQSQGRWKAWPFQIGILDAMGNDAVREVDMMKSARVGYTKCLLASIAYDAHHKKRNQALWQPTDQDSDDFCKTELEPMLRDVRCMRRIFPAFERKSKDNTLQLKKFMTSLLYLRGGTASKNYRRITVASAKLDEIDGFEQLIERSSDPVTLSGKRLEGAAFPKHILGSTPRIKGLSHVEGRSLLAQARMKFQMICPHCGVEHPLEWGGKDVAYGIKWSAEDPSQVWHVCHHCHDTITQPDYLRTWNQGAWVSACGNWRYASASGDWRNMDGAWYDGAGMPCRAPRHVAFHVWTIYSPQVTWAEIVQQFLQAMAKRKAGDKGPLIGFINETLGETWEDDDAEKLESNGLKARAISYGLRTVPMGGLVLVAGVDVQSNRFEVVVWAIGRGEQMWAVDYNVIPANPAEDDEWLKLDAYLQSSFLHESGHEIEIAAVGIDMMGDFTHQGYNFVRERERRKVYGVRGDPIPGKPISGKPTLQDVNLRGKWLKRGVKLWYVGTDTAKDLLFGRLKVPDPGPGYINFSAALPDAFYSQLTAESRVPVVTSKGTITRWVNVDRARNEVLDCTVYAMFAAHRLGLHTYTDLMWKRREAALQPIDGLPTKAVPAARDAAPPVATAARLAAAPVQPARRLVSAPRSFASDDWSDRL